MVSSKKDKIAIVGCGLIGSSWATLFASAGYDVWLYDITIEIIEAAKKRILGNLKTLEENDLLRGPGCAEDQFKNISSSLELGECLRGALYCQESVAECLEVKKEIFTKMDELVDDKTILASSTSAIPASCFVDKLKNRARCLVAHPVNPPLYIRLIEIVPTPWTPPEITQTVRGLMTKIGQVPICVKKEVPGFALNRIQYAIIEEAWRMVHDGIVSPDDIDTVMKEGLGPRYAFYGPFEVMHLNANGISDYMKRYMGGVEKVVKDFGPMPLFNEESVIELLSKCLDAKMPIEKLSDFLKERESRLNELSKLKRLAESQRQNSSNGRPSS